MVSVCCLLTQCQERDGGIQFLASVSDHQPMILKLCQAGGTTSSFYWGLGLGLLNAASSFIISFEKLFSHLTNFSEEAYKCICKPEVNLKLVTRQCYTDYLICFISLEDERVYIPLNTETYCRFNKPRKQTHSNTATGATCIFLIY